MKSKKRIIILGAIIQGLFSPTRKHPVAFFNKEEEETNYATGILFTVLIPLIILIIVLKTFL